MDLQTTAGPGVLEALQLDGGLQIDLDEGWQKLIARQFADEPARGFCELVQNLLDSYPARVPWSERRAEIESGPRWVRITDQGEGLDRARLALLVTLGGTDKRDDPQKIGMFGVGFFSIFNPALGAELVRVTTRCEGQAVELRYVVERPGERPRLEARLLDGELPYSTRVEVTFDNARAPRRCLAHAKTYLRYYPCPATIDGEPQESVWSDDEGVSADGLGACRCQVRDVGREASITVLCKYELVMKDYPLATLLGGRTATRDLRDYRDAQVPYVPGVAVLANADDLRLTISRDGFYLDEAYRSMLRRARSAMLQHLDRRLEWEVGVRGHRTKPTIIANQYVLARDLRRHLQRAQLLRPQAVDEAASVAERLASAKVYGLDGETGEFSLYDLLARRKGEGPVFFSSRRDEVRWLGGAFERDFIIITPLVLFGGGAPDLYESIFSDVFGDAVNLDTIAQDTERARDLAARGVIEESALEPSVRFVEELRLTDGERELLAEINELLGEEPICDAIGEVFGVSPRSIVASYFDVEDETIVFETGLFDEEGRPYGASAGASGVSRDDGDRELRVGIRRTHSFVRELVSATARHRAFYSLTYVADQLATWQRLSGQVDTGQSRQLLGAAMRRAMLRTILLDDPGDQ